MRTAIFFAGLIAWSYLCFAYAFRFQSARTACRESCSGRRTGATSPRCPRLVQSGKCNRSRPMCGRRNMRLALGGEGQIVGVVVAGVATVAAVRAASTLVGAFKLADYRTTSGHDLRLDEKLQSQRRQLLPSSSEPPRTSSVDCATDGGVPNSGSGMDSEIDWREEIRVASQLPDEGNGAWIGVDDAGVARRKE
ncbi:unnamed protein product [Scytosiphon promiscuus]